MCGTAEAVPLPDCLPDCPPGLSVLDCLTGQRAAPGVFQCYVMRCEPHGTGPGSHVCTGGIGSARMSRFTEGATVAKKIDPLNKKNYGAVSTMLTVSDVKAAIAEAVAASA